MLPQITTIQKDIREPFVEGMKEFKKKKLLNCSNLHLELSTNLRHKHHHMK